MTFPRLEDGARSYSIVERSDGVRYRVYDGTATSRLPHDLGHLIVERETGDHGGFWGAVAAGVVFASMEHLDGRRPPHAAERSTAAMRERSDDLRRAELMVWLTGRIAREGVTSPERVRIAAREALSTFPGASVDENAVLARAAGRCRRRRQRLGGAGAGRGARAWSGRSAAPAGRGRSAGRGANRGRARGRTRRTAPPAVSRTSSPSGRPERPVSGAGCSERSRDRDRRRAYLSAPCTSASARAHRAPCARARRGVHRGR